MRPTARRRVRAFVPPQHGAWAMLAVPYLAGLIVGGYRWPDLPLLGAWLAGYLLSYYLFQAVKSRRPGRYRPQLALYAAIAAPLLAAVVAARPQVLWYAPAYAVLFAINAGYAFRRRERALANDLASVVQSCLMVLVVAAAAAPLDTAAVAAPLSTAAVAAPPRIPLAAYHAFALCLAYFAGTVLYVKTMIRERGSRTYRRWSVGFHALTVVAAAWSGPWAMLLFAWLLVRAALLPVRGLAAKQVGLVEIANSVLLLVLIGAALG